ncbi:hypothetical protein ABT120_44250 [Nonomuraea angiospora]
MVGALFAERLTGSLSGLAPSLGGTGGHVPRAGVVEGHGVGSVQHAEQ